MPLRYSFLTNHPQSRETLACVCAIRTLRRRLMSEPRHACEGEPATGIRRHRGSHSAATIARWWAASERKTALCEPASAPLPEDELRSVASTARMRDEGKKPTNGRTTRSIGRRKLVERRGLGGKTGENPGRNHQCQNPVAAGNIGSPEQVGVSAGLVRTAVSPELKVWNLHASARNLRPESWADSQGPIRKCGALVFLRAGHFCDMGVFACGYAVVACDGLRSGLPRVALDVSIHTPIRKLS